MSSPETARPGSRYRDRMRPFVRALRSCARVACIAALGARAVCAGPAEHWVTTWATAQALAADPVPQGLKPPPKAAKGSPIPEHPAALSNRTVRMLLRASVGGRRVRVQLSNRHGAQAVMIAASHVALSGEGARILAGSDRVLRFGGRPEVTIPAGATVLSDAVDLIIQPAGALTVSLYVADSAATETVHALGLHTTYLIAGDATGASDPRAESQNLSYFWLSAVDVEAPGAATVVAFGDSITDGYATTPNRDQAWPALLYARLRAADGTGAKGVINLGISGNRVLHDRAGSNALARFDRDVLSQEGVRWVILLEGINDISYSAIPGVPASERVSAEDLIAGYRMLIAKAHLHGMRMVGATILPCQGVWTYTPEGEAVRERVNDWVRRGGEFDGIIDFDKATRDPSAPKRLMAAYDSGDHVHPNDAGNLAMAGAVDLALFH